MPNPHLLYTAVDQSGRKTKGLYIYIYNTTKGYIYLSIYVYIPDAKKGLGLFRAWGLHGVGFEDADAARQLGDDRGESSPV